MAMEREQHENLLIELINPELEQSRRTEILQELRVDYGGVLTDIITFSEANAKLVNDNSDLVVSNSKLFRQLGVVGGDADDQKKVEEKEFSETVTLESLEK